MNPTLGHFCNVLSHAWSTRRAEVRRLVSTDLMAAPPKAGELFAGQQALLSRCARRSSGCSYYVAETITAAVVAVGGGVAAYVLATDPEAVMATQAAAGALAGAAVIGAYHAIARRLGPSFIDAARLAQAQKNLNESGDIHVRPLSVLTTATMAAMFIADGCFAGFTLATAAFASVFTPRMVTAAGVAFSCACAWLLYHLAKEAAQEGAVNERRNVVRNLLASPAEADCKHGEAMMAHVGHALGNDISRSANRMRARFALALVVLGLSVATFVVRVSVETEDAAAVPVPAAVDPERP